MENCNDYSLAIDKIITTLKVRHSSQNDVKLYSVLNLKEGIIIYFIIFLLLFFSSLFYIICIITFAEIEWDILIILVEIDAI